MIRIFFKDGTTVKQRNISSNVTLALIAAGYDSVNNV